MFFKRFIAGRRIRDWAEKINNDLMIISLANL
jgi:hypothetical protein